MADETQQSPGFMAAMIQALRNWAASRNPNDQALAGRDVSQQIAGQLPPAVMPHDALARKRQEQALLEQIARGGE